MLLSGFLALITAAAATIFLGLASNDIFGHFFAQDGGYIIYDLIIAICIFFIVKHNYKSFWYVPLIANLFGIFAFYKQSFSSERELNYIFIGWGLSIIVTIIAVLIGKKKKLQSTRSKG